ncbi:MAG: Omp28-related outer membrane protein [Bacteroidales bacterium]|nr:Omp28-related outer membrane protein [Bacteroidales bacterium]
MKIYKMILLFAAAVLMAACEKSGDESNSKTPAADSELVLKVDKIYIQSKVDAATFTLTLAGEPVTEGVTFYDGSTNAVVDIKDMKFTADADGTYSFWASYMTFTSNTVVVKAIPMAVPSNPVDEDKSNTSFRRRVLMTQFTGTGCPNCPYMISALHKVYEKEAYSSKVVHVSSHTSWASTFYLEKDVHGFMGVSGAPWLVADFDKSSKIGAYSDTDRTAMDIEYVIDEWYDAQEPMAGIAVNSVLSGKTLAVKALVKAAETAEYRVGAWLLEDDLISEQAGASQEWMNKHNNVLRIADSEISQSNFSGHKLGQIKAGEYSEYVFVMELDPSWQEENLHLAVFITNGGLVNNVVDCKVGESIGFDYAE